VAKVELAAEWEFKDKFPGCDLGAMPPFGNLYGMHVFVAEELTADKEIAFNAGSHTELIRMSYKDFENLVRPRVVRLTSAPGWSSGNSRPERPMPLRLDTRRACDAATSVCRARASARP